MDINQAIFLLIEGCELAQNKGAYSLAEAKQIAEAIEFIDSVSNKNTQNVRNERQGVNITTKPTSDQDDGESLDAN